MENNVKDFIVSFAGILYEALPWIVLGAVLAGILEELSPQKAFAFMGALSGGLLLLLLSPLPLEWNLGLAVVVFGVVLALLLRARPLVEGFLHYLSRHRIQAIMLSGLLGLFIPMCECGILVVTRRLLRKGLPLGCCMAYILAGPIINIVVLLATYVAFVSYDPAQMGGPWMMIFRAGLGYLVATGTALVVDRQYRKHGVNLLVPSLRADVIAASRAKATLDENDSDAPPRTLSKRAAHAAETALHDFVDIMVFLIIGALFAAVARRFLSHNEIERLNNPFVAIPVMMGIAILICLCSEADAFIAASFQSLHPAAKLAFLVLGPMLDLKLYMMYTQVFRPRLIWTVIVCVVIQVFLYSVVVHYCWPEFYGRLSSGLFWSTPALP